MYLPLKQAAKLLGVSRWTCWRMVLEGQIPPSQVLRSGKKRPRLRISSRFVHGESRGGASAEDAV